MSDNSPYTAGTHTFACSRAPSYRDLHDDPKAPLKAMDAAAGDDESMTEDTVQIDSTTPVIQLADAEDKLGSIVKIKVGQDAEAVILQQDHGEMKRFIPSLCETFLQPVNEGDIQELPNANPKAMFLIMSIGHRRFDKLPASDPSKTMYDLASAYQVWLLIGLCNPSCVPDSNN
jgi:hypothetical protein